MVLTHFLWLQLLWMLTFQTSVLESLKITGFALRIWKGQVCMLLSNGVHALSAWGPPEFSIIRYQLSTQTHTKSRSLQTEPELWLLKDGGWICLKPVRDRGRSSSSWQLLQKHAWKQKNKNINIVRKARGTKQCSAYSHPCTVPLHRCSEASAGPNAAAFSARGQWPCMELFHFFNLGLCQTPSVLPV